MKEPGFDRSSWGKPLESEVNAKIGTVLHARSVPLVLFMHSLTLCKVTFMLSLARAAFAYIGASDSWCSAAWHADCIGDINDIH